MYVESSVLLRVALAEPGQLREWSKITQGVASELVRLECLRTIDRARIRLRLSDQEVASRRQGILARLEGLITVPLSPEVLERAAQPMPTLLGSLDAIHLASAVLARDQIPDLSLATHDGELAIAGRAMGFQVYGAPSRT